MTKMLLRVALSKTSSTTHSLENKASTFCARVKLSGCVYRKIDESILATA